MLIHKKSINKNNSKKVLLNFLPNIFVMFNIPHRDPKKLSWSRSNGIMKLMISSDNKGIPYGSYARLILFYITTQAIRKKSPFIYLGESFNDFIKKINMNSTGGKQFSLIQNQLERLLSAKFSLLKKEDNIYSNKEFTISKNYNKDLKNINFIHLSDRFYNEIIRSSVPINFEIIKEYKNSPLFLDLYTFLLWRTYNLKKVTHINLNNLKYQLGSQYKNISEFARNCYKYIRIIKILCPHINIEIAKEKIILTP